MTRRPLARAALATFASLVLVACSSDDESSTTSVTAPATAPDASAPAAPTSATARASDSVATSDSATSDSASDTTESVPAPDTVESAPTSDTTGDTTETTDDPTDTTEPASGEPLTIDELLALERPIVLAHAGGEDVHPHSTPFAYAESVAAGVDMLDFDVRLTADGVLVVHHDDDVDRTTNGTGLVATMTYEELHALDNAHWFTDRCVCTDAPPSEYVYRGIRTGEVDPPPGYAPEDFAVPRLRDIITRFPSMPLNIEIKSRGEEGLEAARILAEELAELDRLDHAVVTSFDDAVNDAFRALAPDVEITPGLGAASGWVLERVPLPHGMRILQLPPEFQGTEVLTPAVIADSIAAGYPIWVWPDDRSLEDFGGYQRFLLMGLAGLNANDPAAAVAAVEAHLADEQDDPPSTPVEAAASAAQAALMEGDSLGDCPYGPTVDLIAALPESLPLAEGFFGPDGVEDNGQVFIGGDVDIVYCVLRPDDSSEGPLEEIRLDVAPDSGVDIAQYLDEEFTSDDVELTGGGDLADGTFSTGCWDDSDACGAFWQGEGLFIATVLSGEEAQAESDAATVLEVLVPLVIERLAARAT